MAAELPLERLQQWMQGVIVHSSTVGEALRDPSLSGVVAPGELAQVILPSRTLEPAERLAIYQGMYPLRMEEALASDYPGVKHFLGDDAFFALVKGYVDAHPSRSFTLNPLGRHLPEYVREAPGVRRRDFAHDLARLERAMAQAFDAEQVAALSEEQVAAIPPEAWEGARLTPVAACQLLAFRYPVGPWLDSLQDPQHRHPPGRRRDSHAVVYRREYSVYRLDLSRPAHDLLADLLAGRTLGEAVGAALRRGRPRPDSDTLFRWFRQWVAAGIFGDVRT